MPESMERTRAWSKERIEDVLSRERFDYQKVPLPFGLHTRGHERDSTARLIFPGSLSGKSVLDVGSSLGFFCFEAEKRGAAEVQGVDVDPESVRKAKILADILESRVNFAALDLDNMPLGRFDYVLCLNVLHHVHDPLAVLNKLIDATKETLVLEVATFGSHDKKKVRLPALVCKFLAWFPIIFVTSTGTRGEREIQRFYLSESAIRNLLITHRGVFARLEVKKSPHKDRFIVLAHRRRIDHLLVVAGPTSAGKKTIEQLLAANKLPEFAKIVNVPDTSVWSTVLTANHIDDPDIPYRSHLLFHYDILRPFLRSTRTYERDEALEIIDCAKRVTFLTVLTPPARLREQITVGEIEKRSTFFRKPSQRHLRIRDLYADPVKVQRAYETWRTFVGKRNFEHWMIEAQPDGSHRLFPAADWKGF